MAYIIKKYAIDYKTLEVVPRIRVESVYTEGVETKKWIGEIVINYEILFDNGEKTVTGTCHRVLESVIEKTVADIWKKVDELGGASAFEQSIRGAVLTSKTMADIYFDETISNLSLITDEKKKEVLNSIPRSIIDQWIIDNPVTKPEPPPIP